MIRPSRLFLLLTLVATIGLGWPSDAAAQRRAPAGRTTGVAVPRTSAQRYYRPYYPSRYHYPYGGYYYPYAFARPYYSPYYSSFGFGFAFGWPGAYWGGYGYPYAYSYAYPYAYPYYWYDNTGSARLLISPRNAEVYIDGRFVGRVDDFDGSFQRLRVDNGPHEIQIYLDGHRTFTQKVLFTQGTTVKIAHAMQPLSPGDQAEPKPAPNPATPSPDRYQSRPLPPSREGQPAEFGTLAVRVKPHDAEILIDGETWDRPAGEEGLSIDLAEGPHEIEIRKEGYSPYVRTVDVLRGRTFTLNVSLPPGGPGMVRISTRR
jgi:hypothetical protein